MQRNEHSEIKQPVVYYYTDGRPVDLTAFKVFPEGKGPHKKYYLQTKSGDIFFENNSRIQVYTHAGLKGKKRREKAKYYYLNSQPVDLTTLDVISEGSGAYKKYYLTTKNGDLCFENNSRIQVYTHAGLREKKRREKQEYYYLNGQPVDLTTLDVIPEGRGPHKKYYIKSKTGGDYLKNEDNIQIKVYTLSGLRRRKLLEKEKYYYLNGQPVDLTAFKVFSEGSGPQKKYYLQTKSGDICLENNSRIQVYTHDGLRSKKSREKYCYLNDQPVDLNTLDVLSEGKGPHKKFYIKSKTGGDYLKGEDGERIQVYTFNGLKSRKQRANLKGTYVYKEKQDIHGNAIPIPSNLKVIPEEAGRHIKYFLKDGDEFVIDENCKRIEAERIDPFKRNERRKRKATTTQETPPTKRRKITDSTISSSSNIELEVKEEFESVEEHYAARKDRYPSLVMIKGEGAIEEDEVNTPISKLDKEELKEVIDILVSNATEGRRTDCAYLSEGIILYFLTGKKPDRGVSNTFSLLHFEVFLTKATVKEETEEDNPINIISIINRNSSFGALAPCNEFSAPVLELGQDNCFTEVEKRTYVDVDNYQQTPIHVSKLYAELKSLAKNNASKISFGIIALGRCGKYVDEPGHLIAYFATPTSVCLVECQASVPSKRLFANLVTNKDFKFADTEEEIANADPDTFSSRVFFTPMNHVKLRKQKEKVPDLTSHTEPELTLEIEEMPSSESIQNSSPIVTALQAKETSNSKQIDDDDSSEDSLELIPAQRMRSAHSSEQNYSLSSFQVPLRSSQEVLSREKQNQPIQSPVPQALSNHPSQFFHQNPRSARITPLAQPHYRQLSDERQQQVAAQQQNVVQKVATYLPQPTTPQQVAYHHNAASQVHAFNPTQSTHQQPKGRPVYPQQSVGYPQQQVTAPQQQVNSHYTESQVHSPNQTYQTQSTYQQSQGYVYPQQPVGYPQQQVTAPQQQVNSHYTESQVHTPNQTYQTQSTYQQSQGYVYPQQPVAYPQQQVTPPQQQAAYSYAPQVHKPNQTYPAQSAYQQPEGRPVYPQQQVTYPQQPQVMQPHYAAPQSYGEQRQPFQRSQQNFFTQAQLSQQRPYADQNNTNVQNPSQNPQVNPYDATRFPPMRGGW